MMDLFAQSSRDYAAAQAPLAVRMRPRTLDEFVGQTELVGGSHPLQQAIARDRLFSMILYGPPGSGKTTLAFVIAGATKAHFEQINAVTAGVADIRRVIGEARDRLHMQRARTVLFIDEIHRFNKGQQDALLPAVEEGTVILIGATTENPYFEVNSPLLSRARVVRLQALSDAEIAQVLRGALEDRERGLGGRGLSLEPAALDHIVAVANGDARTALNALDLAAAATEEQPAEAGASETVDAAGASETADAADPSGKTIRLQDVVAAVQRRSVRYDAAGDNHYDTISAFIKSLRGSDPDAALYWLARMLYAGEDPRFIVRRLVVHASEDVGNADPQALSVAVAAAHALELVGLPEARLALAQAAVYIANAPKSNAVYAGLSRAGVDVEGERWDPVPAHLRDTGYAGAAALGHGRGYLYPHDFPDHHAPQQYLPDNLAGRRYYEPTDQGREAEVAEILARRRRAGSGDAEDTGDGRRVGGIGDIGNAGDTGE